MEKESQIFLFIFHSWFLKSCFTFSPIYKLHHKAERQESLIMKKNNLLASIVLMEMISATSLVAVRAVQVI